MARWKGDPPLSYRLLVKSRADLASGALARKFGISWTHANRIVLRRAWKELEALHEEESRAD
jgi:hypothetical protein